MKRFVMVLVAITALIGAGMANAQRGGSHGGGSMGGMSGSHGGGSWSGGSHSGSWSGGHGSWSGSHGGSWNGSWHGGWHGNGWHHGNTVVVGFGPWWGWGWGWPGWYPYGYAYPAAYPYDPYYGYGEYYPVPMYDSGAYVQRPDAAYQGQQQYQGGQVTSDGYAYYCPNPAGYYPQIPTCAAGWLRVVPQGAPAPGEPAQR